MGNCCCKCSCFRRNIKKKIVLLLVGLDNAGKTTAAKGLAGEIVDFTIPTVGFTAIKPKTKGYDVTIYDLGGGTQIRGIWSSYFHYVHGVIYVVDASDLNRIEEAKSTLENLLLDEKLAGKPVLVLANKQDQISALDEIDIVEALHLEPLVNQQKCHTLVKVCSAIPGSPGRKRRNIDKRLLIGYRWLLSQIHKEYGVLNNRVESDSKAETERFEVRRALQRKRYEELNKDVPESNGIEVNGFSSDTNSIGQVSSNLTSDVREQLEHKGARQKFKFGRGRRKNKVHPEISESNEDSKKPKPISFISIGTYFPEDTSMTLKALTSPLHDSLYRHSTQKMKSSSFRPFTSRSLGHEVGVWGLERELDVIHPSPRPKQTTTEDESNDEIVVEYLKKDTVHK